MLKLIVAVGGCCGLSMSASAQVQYLTQARTAKAQSIAMPAQVATASDFSLFRVRLSSVATPDSGANGTATASQISLLNPMQMRCSGGASRGQSTGFFSGYGNASSMHNVKFSVPVDTPVNFISSIDRANVGLTGPGINFAHGYINDANESGILLAGQTYTVYAETTGEVSAGHALPGSYSYTLTLGNPPDAPTSGHSSASSAVCPGTAVVVSVAAPAPGYVIDWYNDSVFQGTGADLTVYPPSGPAQIYSAQTRRLADNAVSINMINVSVAVQYAPTPSSLKTSRDNFCQYDTGTIKLTAGTAGGGTYQWTVGSCDGPIIGTGSSITIPSPRMTTSYFVKIVNECMVGECATRTVNVQVCPGDFSCDGVVDDGDFVQFVTGYDLLLCSDAAMPESCPADINEDGLVDDVDFQLFLLVYDNLVCP